MIALKSTGNKTQRKTALNGFYYVTEIQESLPFRHPTPYGHCRNYDGIWWSKYLEIILKSGISALVISLKSRCFHSFVTHYAPPRCAQVCPERYICPIEGITRFATFDKKCAVPKRAVEGVTIASIPAECRKHRRNRVIHK